MLRLSALIAPVTAGLLLLPTPGSASGTTGPLGMVWHDGSTLPIEGKGWADSHTHYHRLPSRAKSHVSDMVWRLASNTSGLTLRFVTDSTTIAAQWDGGTPMNHMAATGSHGLDLYTRPWSEDGTAGGPWKYAGTGRPSTTATTAVITRNRPAKLAEYLLYLPTYAPVTTLTLGLDPGARLLPGRPRDPARKPIVFYGTSITQAGCASRSGMGHTSILGRWLDREVINLGFSGSGKTEPAIIRLIAELDPALFVLEPLPNMTTEMVTERMGTAVELIREKHPETPILLVANPLNPDDHAQNRSLRMEFDRLQERGDKNLHYLPSAGQLDGREEGTVDGVHPTDLGFERMATAYEPVLRRILGEK
jgi:hypothetical protein